jgi:hypothetical protein
MKNLTITAPILASRHLAATLFSFFFAFWL